MSDLLFATVALPLLDKRKATEQILAVPDQHWFWDKYRATNMLPLMTKNGASGAAGASNLRDGEFTWLPYTPALVREWFEDVVFKFMGQRTRIMALKTAPQFANNEHIDSQLHEVGALQHKFRLVLKGRTDTLYFLTKGGVVRAPSVNGCFLMDGSWPHGMLNDDDDLKLTLAAGAPWSGRPEYGVEVQELLRRSEHELPEHLTQWAQQ